MLLSKARERDIVGNTVPENMAVAEKRLEEPSKATIREAESWDWSSEPTAPVARMSDAQVADAGAPEPRTPVARMRKRRLRKDEVLQLGSV